MFLFEWLLVLDCGLSRGLGLILDHSMFGFGSKEESYSRILYAILLTIDTAELSDDTPNSAPDDGLDAVTLLLR